MKKLLAIVLAVAAAISCGAFAGADGQNPAMNIIGLYQDSLSQRATMSISPLGSNEAEVTIHWGNSATESVEWHFSGICRTDKGLTIEYDNCIKKLITADGDSTLNEKIEYENGSGKLVFDEDFSHPVWTDDQEDTGARCAFEYAPVDNTTIISSVAIGDSEAAVLEKLGESDDESETAGLKELVYNNATVAGHETELHILLGDDTVRAFRVVTHEGNGDMANDISEFMEAMSNGIAPELSEDKVQSIAEKYCGLSDFSQLGYFGRFAKDGCMMIYIRSSEKDIELVILDHYLQFCEEEQD